MGGGRRDMGRGYEAVGILLVASNTALAYRLYQFSKMSRERMDHPPPLFFTGGGRGSGRREMSLLNFFFIWSKFFSTICYLPLDKKILLEIWPSSVTRRLGVSEKIYIYFFSSFTKRILSYGVKITRMFGRVSYITLSRSADISEEVCERGYSTLADINI